MKYKGIFLIGLAVILCAGFIACQKKVRPDTPLNTAWLMKYAMDIGDYQGFDALFSEGRKGAVSEEEFDAMRETTTAVSEYVQYEVLTFDNGEMLLIRLTPEKVKDAYKIEDVMVIPDDMKPLFDQDRDK